MKVTHWQPYHHPLQCPRSTSSTNRETTQLHPPKFSCLVSLKKFFRLENRCLPKISKIPVLDSNLFRKYFGIGLNIDWRRWDYIRVIYLFFLQCSDHHHFGEIVQQTIPILAGDCGHTGRNLHVLRQNKTSMWSIEKNVFFWRCLPDCSLQLWGISVW